MFEKLKFWGKNNTSNQLISSTSGETKNLEENIQRDVHHQDMTDRNTNRRWRLILASGYLLYLVVFTVAVFFCIICSDKYSITEPVLIKLITFGFTKALALSFISAKYFFNKT